MEPAPAPVVLNLLKFGRVLRGAGIDVHPGRLLDVIEALGYVNLAKRDEVYHACRSLLVHRHVEPLLDAADELRRRTRASGGKRVSESG